MSKELLVYRLLVHVAYPAGFRQEFGPEMVQLFGDLRRHYDRQSRKGRLRFWAHIVQDMIVSAPKEHWQTWRENMTRKEAVACTAGSIFLLYSFAFILFNVLYYSLGLNIWNPFLGLESAEPTLVNGLLNMLVVLGPAVALAFFLLPLLNVRLDIRGDQLATITVQRGSGLSLALMGLCLLAFGIFAVYLIAENLPCLLGAQAIC